MQELRDDDHDYDRECDGDDRGCGRGHEKSDRDGYDLPELSVLTQAQVLILIGVLNNQFYLIIILCKYNILITYHLVLILCFLCFLIVRILLKQRKIS